MRLSANNNYQARHPVPQTEGMAEIPGHTLFDFSHGSFSILVFSGNCGREAPVERANRSGGATTTVALPRLRGEGGVYPGIY